jgi:hypothetical protein
MSVAGREVQVGEGIATSECEPLGSAVRFRLRFLLQEFNLPEGDTLIGRGLDCHITLHDPLVSRRHARIRVDSVRAVLFDLGSRNGSRVNGVRLIEPRYLADRDRIRIGTQELVFAEINDMEPTGARRITGSLVYCAGCVRPYPREIGACPNCGSTGLTEADPQATLMSPGAMRVWAFDLVVELLKKTLASGRPSDIERYLRQALDTIGERIADPKPLDPSQLETLFEASRHLIEQGRQDTWVVTIVALCNQIGVYVPDALARCSAEIESTDTTAVSNPTQPEYSSWHPSSTGNR